MELTPVKGRNSSSSSVTLSECRNSTDSLDSVATSMVTLSPSVASIDSEILSEPERRKSVMLVKTFNESIGMSELTASFKKKSVAFNTVEVREFPVILGCNPAVTKGPPLTISWEALSSSIQSVDEYEDTRPPRKPMLALKSSSLERKYRLKDEGFTSEEFTEVEENVESIRRSRLESAQEKSDLHSIIQEAKRRKAETAKNKKGLVRSTFARLRGRAKVR